MEGNTPNREGFASFPSNIVPAATVPMSKVYQKCKEIEEKINRLYAKLDDIKNVQGEGSKQYNKVLKDIQEQQGKKDALFSGNPQWNWATQWADALITYGNALASDWKDSKIYNYMNGRVDEGEFSHVTELYAGDYGRALPAYIRQVNRMPAMLNRICGEAESIGLRYSISAINSDAVNEKLDRYANEMADMITKQARQKGGITELLGQPLDDSDTWETDLPSFEELTFTNYTTDEEVMVKRGLDYLMRKPDLSYKYKFIQQGFRNYIGTGKMAFEVHNDIEDPNITSIDSRDLFYILKDNNPFIHHGTAAGRRFVATPQDVIDMAPELPADEVEKLQAMTMAYAKGELGEMEITRSGCFVIKINGKMSPLYMNCFRFNWMATKRVRVRVIPNKYDADNPHLKYVSDDENTEAATYKYRYVDELWEGWKFGNIYYQLRPVPGQHIVGDYVGKKMLNFVGIVDPNPSLGELVIPFESLRIQVFYAIERLMSQVQGKILAVDEANEDMDADNAYNMKVYSIYRYNSAKEGDMQLAGLGGSKQINKPEVLDLGLSNAITDLLNFLRFIDLNVDAITGINDARKGIVKSDTGLGQMEAAGAASAMATQPYFNTFYTVVGMTLQKVCESMQRCWANKDIVKYFLGEDGMQLLRLMSESEWNLQQYGVFIENGSNDAEVQRNIIGLAQALMPIQKEPNLALALIKMMNANSAKEAEEIFEKGVKALNKLNEQAAKAGAAQAEQQQQIFMMQEENKTLREKIASLDGPLALERLKQEGKLVATNQKNEFKMDEQTVKKQDSIDTMLAESEIRKDEKVNEAITKTIAEKV